MEVDRTRAGSVRGWRRTCEAGPGEGAGDVVQRAGPGVRGPAPPPLRQHRGQVRGLEAQVEEDTAPGGDLSSGCCHAAGGSVHRVSGL